MSRIKELRDTLKLTQEKFSEKIGLARNTIANYECGRREPTNQVYLSICREFNVNEHWLRTGEGKMFNEQTISLDEYAKKNDLDDIEIEIIKIVMSISKEERKKVINQMKKVFIRSNTEDEVVFTKEISLPDERIGEIAQNIIERGGMILSNKVSDVLVNELATEIIKNINKNAPID